MQILIRDEFIGLNAKAKTINRLEENIGEYIYKFVQGKYFLEMTQK